MRSTPDYHSYHELARQEPSAHYRIRRARRHSAVLILTPHGGGIEPGTSELVLALAGEAYAYYCFEGIRQHGNDRLHITSTHFDEPLGREMAASADWVLAVHGCGDRREKVFIGGLHETWIERFLQGFGAAGFTAERGFGKISGRNPRNICNHGREGCGVQMEVSEGLRRRMFGGLDREGRRHPTGLFDAFVRAGREVLADAAAPAARSAAG